MSNDDSRAAGSEETKTGGAYSSTVTSTWRSTSPGSSAGSEMSVIGPTLVIKGELEAGEDLLIEGTIEGAIRHTSQQLMIGQRGTVKADVRAKNVVVEGRVEGDIYGSESVSIRETAEVRGNIFTPKISITEGATFKGSIDMEVEDVRKH